MMETFRGTKYTSWVDIGMPIISPRILDCVFFLYDNREEAQKGSKYGGTGFFVTVPSAIDKRYDYHYAVTNYHNIEDRHTTIIVKMKNGEYDFLELIPDIDWRYIKGGGDVAVAEVDNILKSNKYDTTHIPISLFAMDNIVKRWGISVGSDVFMVGRFINHDGGPANFPAARLGHISMMPTPIPHMRNGVKDSYCVDTHSRSGFSGSPVFVYNAPGNNLDKCFRFGSPLTDNSRLYLLGIHWGQFPEICEITEKNKSKRTLDIVSGMTCVMTPEPIVEVLNMDHFKKQRSKGDIELQEDFEKHGYPPKLETAKQPIPKSDNPRHKEDFNSLLTAAVKKKPPTDET